jgi:4-amino-4-deoxy-L-arabinose transferase-like glycosyltransferase
MTQPSEFDVHKVGKSIEISFLKLDLWLTALFGSFALLAWASWGKLTELIWDTGHEVEIPARILNGEILYRDIETYYGPLPYYINALGLLIFGQRLEVFYAIGLVLAAIALLLVYTLVKRLTDAPWAALCTLYIVIYCAFRPQGLWNFIVPYSYGVVYATIFSLIAFLALDRYGSSGKAKWLALGAIASGLAGLAKQEFGVAAFIGVLVGANLYPPGTWLAVVKRSLPTILLTGTCVFIPLALLAQQSSWQNLFAALLPLSKSKVLTESGLFDVSLAKTLFEWNQSLRNFLGASGMVGMAIWVADWMVRQTSIASKSARIILELVATVALAAGGLALLQVNSSKQSLLILSAALLVISGTVSIVRWSRQPNSIGNKISIARILKFLLVPMLASIGLLVARRLSCCSVAVFHPLGYLAWLLPALVLWFALKGWHWRRDKHAPLLWTLLLFSLLINARFLFYINFYGLYAVTAVMLFFICLYQLARATKLPIAKYLLICLLIGGILNLTELAAYRYPVRSPQGVAYSKDADLALAFNRSVEFIRNSGKKSVLVVPEGSILNFLSATNSPSRETIFIPGVLPTPKAERDFLKRLEADFPDLIVYVDVPFFWLKPGYQTYGQYNPLVHQWIIEQYRLVHSSPQLVYHDKPWTLRIYGRT